MPAGAVTLAAFITGLVGSVHCVGMCGGIVASLAWQRGLTAAVIPIQPLPLTSGMARQFAFNSGRIATYAVLGALAGGVSAAGIAIGGGYFLRESLYLAAQVLMILLGVHLSGILQPLTVLEQGGAKLWKKIQPLAARLLPVESPARALVLGTLWGCLPCGMIYSMLLTAMTAGSPAGGAAVMLAFGIGTMPALLLVGTAVERGTAILRRPAVRIVAGALIIGLGIFGLLRMPSHESWSALVSLCRDMGIYRVTP